VFDRRLSRAFVDVGRFRLAVRRHDLIICVAVCVDRGDELVLDAGQCGAGGVERRAVVFRLVARFLEAGNHQQQRSAN
jgi:hypothetical protein